MNEWIFLIHHSVSLGFVFTLVASWLHGGYCFPDNMLTSKAERRGDRKSGAKHTDPFYQEANTFPKVPSWLQLTSHWLRLCHKVLPAVKVGKQEGN